MSNQARRKEKQRLKREKKKAQMRRAMSISPYRRIGTDGEIEACYINSDWRERGMASIYLLRQNPAGGHAMAGFLIDNWCVGLKDAWGRREIVSKEFEEYLQVSRERFDVKLTRVDVEFVRKLVAASIRWSVQQGFRLPERYERWTAILGALPPVSDEDLAQFGKDGKLFWVGPLNDLRHRLIGMTIEQFLQRENVDFIAEVTADELDDEDDEYDDDDEEYDDKYDDEDDELFDQLLEVHTELLDVQSHLLAARIRQTCFATNRHPHARLDDAVGFILAVRWLPRDQNLAPVEVAIAPQAALHELPLPRVLADRDDMLELDDETYAAVLNVRALVADDSLISLIGTPENINFPDDLREAVRQAVQVSGKSQRRINRRVIVDAGSHAAGKDRNSNIRYRRSTID